jgi:hypothetical protein
MVIGDTKGNKNVDIWAAENRIALVFYFLGFLFDPPLALEAV